MKILFILICIISARVMAQNKNLFSESESESNGIYSTIDDADNLPVNFSNFKDEMNFLEKKSNEITVFLEKNKNPAEEHSDEISLNSSALQKPRVDEIKTSLKSEEEVRALLEPVDSKVHPRRVRQR